MKKRVLLIGLGLGLLLSSLIPIFTLAAEPEQNFVVEPQIAAGYLHTVALKWDGNVIATGYNGYGQCNVNGWSGITWVAAGKYHTVGLKSDGTVVAAGNNDYGQCTVSGWSGITQVAAGESHTLGLKSDGTVVAAGNNDYGQCNVSSWSGITQVSAGESHTLGLKSDGTVVAAGNNDYGQCNVSSWSGITQVAAGESHSLGLKSDGTIVAAGNNDLGQCNVSSWSGITQVAAGVYHSIALRADGTVVANGNNGLGQCDVGSWSGIIQVIAGGYHSVGLKPDGTVKAVGYNYFGQCDVAGWQLQDNRAPLANSQSLSTNEDTPVSIILTANDPDQNTLTYTILANPAHGVLTGIAPNLTYTPDTRYNGPDEFTFKVNDGTVDSNVATISITVIPVNDPPVIESLTVNPSEIWSPNHKPVGVTITAIVSDPDGTEDIKTITYSVNDEYGEYNVPETAMPSNSIIALIAERNGKDKDGRVYKITVKVYDNAGQADSRNVAVIVPH